MRRLARSRDAVLVTAALAAAIAGTSRADDDLPEGDPPATPAPAARKVDKTSPEARALDELLFVDPNYGEDKRVELTYTFSEPGEQEDFEVRGFDKAEVAGSSYGLGFEFGVGSRGQGLVLHNLAFKGDYEVEYRLRIDWIAPSSQLVFVFADGKSGGMWGPYFAKRRSRGYRPVARVEVDRGRLGGGREVKLKYEVEGDEVTCFVDGVKVASTEKLKGKLDGRLGIYMTNMRLVLLGATIKGEPDPEKL